MQLSIKFTDMGRDEDARAYAEEKTAAFSKVIDAAFLDAAFCNVEFKKSAHHQSGDVCYAEVTLETDGKIYRASEEAATLRNAMDKVKDEIVRQLERSKSKKENVFRRGARLAKRLLRGGDFNA